MFPSSIAALPTEEKRNYMQKETKMEPSQHTGCDAEHRPQNYAKTNKGFNIF